MRDPATDRNRDGAVTIAELGDRTRRRTLEIGSKIGHRQTPVILGFGRDLPLYRPQ
ncbi:hypothetical protein D3C83_274380 [compost metagenome]